MPKTLKNKSKNCWEELAWAAEIRNSKDNPDKKTILVFTNKDHWVTVSKTNEFEFTWGEKPPRKFDWAELTAKIGFSNEEKDIITAENVEEVAEKVKEYVSSKR